VVSCLVARLLDSQLFTHAERFAIHFMMRNANRLPIAYENFWADYFLLCGPVCESDTYPQPFLVEWVRFDITDRWWSG